MNNVVEARPSSDLLTIDDQNRFPATADQVMQHVKIIDDVKKKVMKDGTHYGVIPGCGDKPALLKPGAEKLCLTFRLTHEFEMQTEEFQNGHRQYTVNFHLRYRDGTLVGQGVGICSTMESKYRYRTDNTGQPVPQDYWNNRDQELLGGSDYFPQKRSGKWVICRKVEHDNPADYYNTCAKMAKKRAHVDATLSATAASDIFEQDIDEGLPGSTGEPTPQDEPHEAPQASAGPAEATEAQISLIRGKIGQAGIEESELLKHLGVEALEGMAFGKVNEALSYVKEHGSK